MAIAIGALLLLLSVAIAVGTTLYLRAPRVGLPAGLQEQRRDLQRRLRAAIGRTPKKPDLASGVVVHPESGAVEARLCAGQPRGALAEAERVLGQAPEDAAAHALVARALVACGELEAAAGEISRARELGLGGAVLDYLEARVRHLARVRAADAANAEIQESPVPALVTPFEMLILQLEQQRRASGKSGAIWLAGGADQTLDHDQILAAVTEHFEAYYRDLDQLLTAVEAEPGFGEALYHLGRLALKVGFVAEGRDLFERLDPLLADTPERRYYERDIAQLRDDPDQVTWQPEAQPASLRRITKLRIVE